MKLYPFSLHLQIDPILVDVVYLQVVNFKMHIEILYMIAENGPKKQS